MEPKLVIVHGTSGATIHVADHEAIKYSPVQAHWARIDAQAEYMLRIGPPFAAIHGIARGRYWMERLDPYFTPWSTTNWNKSILDPEELFMPARKMLFLLWTRPYVSGPSYADPSWKTEHVGYVERLLVRVPTLIAVNLRKRMYEVFDIEHKLEYATTHGDATLDNLMVNKDGDCVWIDPIPPSRHLPNLIAADIGKLLQSAAGYEYVKNGMELKSWPREEMDSIVLDGFKEHETRAARYFFLLACLRMLPYTEGRVHYWALKELEQGCNSSSI